jgi:hypothetical protein
MKRICRCALCSLPTLILLSITLAFANPKSMVLQAPPAAVFKAAQKAAAGHKIVIPQDEGLEQLNEAGEEIKSFKFATSLAGVTFRVIENISVEPLPDGTSKLEVWFYKDRGSNVYVPSDAYELREAQLKNQLEKKLNALELEGSEYETQYEVTHTIDLKTYVAKKSDVLRRERDAKIQELQQERDAKIADLAGMPTSSFPTMEVAADKFFSLVQQNLQTSKTNASIGTNH